MHYIPFILLDLLSHVISDSYKALSLYFTQVLIQSPFEYFQQKKLVYCYNVIDLSCIYQVKTPDGLNYLNQLKHFYALLSCLFKKNVCIFKQY